MCLPFELFSTEYVELNSTTLKRSISKKTSKLRLVDAQSPLSTLKTSLMAQHLGQHLKLSAQMGRSIRSSVLFYISSLN